MRSEIDLPVNAQVERFGRYIECVALLERA